MNRLLIMAIWTILIMAVGLTALVGYWELNPYKVLVFNTPFFKVTRSVFHKGESLTYISDYCKYMNLPAQVTRTFSNDLIFTTPTIDTNRDTGCHVITVAVIIPKELPSGKYHLQNIYKFRVNPIRDIKIEQHTEDFTVVD